MRFYFLTGLTLVIALYFSSCSPDYKELRGKDPRPNIVLIVADDLGIGSLSCYNDKVSEKTPNLDRLASEGWLFDQFYATSPVCSPSRASILTGKTPQLIGLEKVLKPGREDEQPGEISSHITFASILKDAGYQTACIGKWHLGYTSKDHPTNNGFNYFAGFLNGHIDYISHTDPNGKFHLEKEGNPWKVKEKQHLTEVLTDEAIKQIENMAGASYFLMVSYANPHSPIILPGEEALFPEQAKTKNDTPERYQKLVALLDKEIGKLVAAIKKQHENTLIIFISDQGSPAHLKGNYPYLGGKSNLLEGGIKVPCIVNWQGKLSPQRNQNFTTGLDLFPTILNAANISDSVFSSKLIGNNMLKSEYNKNEVFGWEFRTALVVRKSDWKAIFLPKNNNNQKNINQYLETVPDKPIEYIPGDNGVSYLVWLFNLENDATEKINLATTNPEKLNEMWMEYQNKAKNQNK